MRAQFVLSEMAIGLRRNLTMTIAAILTSAIALTLLGAALLLYSQVGVMKDYWYGKVEVSVFLCQKTSDAPSCSSGAVTQAQKNEIKSDIEALPEVDTVFYESQQDAYDRFKDQFKNSAIVNNVTRLLDQRHIQYEAFELPAEKLGARETAELLEIDPAVVYKTIVVTRDKPKRPLLVVVPGDSVVDLKRVAAAVGERSARSATACSSWLGGNVNGRRR